MIQHIEPPADSVSQGLLNTRRVAPTNSFVQFRKEEIEQSIADRFEQTARKYSDQIAVNTKKATVTYDELNRAANRLAHAILTKCGKGEQRVSLILEHDIVNDRWYSGSLQGR